MPLYDHNGNVIGQIPQAPQKNFLAGLVEQPDRFLRGISELTNRAIGNQKDQFLTRQEAETYKKDPMNILKDAAGYASFAIPNPILAGTAAGFGSTYGNSDLGQTVTGTALGGGTAGALGIVAKALSKIPGFGKFLNKTGQGLEEGVVAKSVQPNRFAVTGIQDAESLGQQVARNMKNRIGSISKEGIGDAYKLASQDYAGIISNAQGKIPTKGLASEALNAAKLETDITRGVGKNNVEFLNSKFAELGDNATPQQLSDLKFQLQNDLGSAYKKIQKGMPLSPKEKVVMAYHDAIDGALKQAVPEAAPVLQELSQYHRASPDIIKAFTKGEQLPVPATFGKVNIPLRNTKDKVQAGLGRLLQKAPTSGKSGSISTQLQSLMKNPTLAAILPKLIQSGQGGSQSTELSNYDTNQVGFDITQSGYPSESSGDYGSQVARQLINAGMKASDVKTLQDIGAIPKPKGDGKAPSAAERKQNAQAQAGLRGMQGIQSALSKDPSVLQKSVLPEALQDENTKSFRNYVDSAAESYGRLQSGGAINHEEEARFKNQVYSIFASPASQQQKIQLLNQYFTDILG